MKQAAHVSGYGRWNSNWLVSAQLAPLIFLVLAVLALSPLVLKIMRPFLTPFILASMLAIVVNPANTWVRSELKRSKIDVFAGSFISKLITYFITITTAASLFVSGKRDITTAKEAAAALQPVAGEGALLLFALGVIGTGLLAVPVLAGSCAYAWSEAMRWRASLEEPPHFAPKFYGVLVLAVGIGLAMIYLGINVVQMLFWASLLNGLLAPGCILVTVLLTSDPKIMGERANRGWMRVSGWIAFTVTAAAAAALLVFSIL